MTKRARICFVVSSEMTVKAFLKEQIIALSELYDVTLVVNTDSEDFAEQSGLSCKVIPLTIERTINPVADIRALYSLVHLFRREHFDLVHSVTPKAGLLAMLAGKMAGVRLRVHTFTGQVWATRTGFSRLLLKVMDRFLAPMFDVHATTYASAIKRAEEDGIDSCMLTQWAADSSRMAPPLPASECDYKVSFVGSMYGNRKQWISDLEQRGIHVDTFGYGWPKGPVEAEDIAGIIRTTQISLNLGDSGVVMEGGKLTRSRQIKARVFEVPGAGGLLATESADHLQEFYQPGKEIIVFKDINDLVEKIEYLLAHPDARDAIAQAGYDRTRAAHSYEARFEPLIELALARRQKRPAALNPIDFEQFQNFFQLHRPHVLLKFLKAVLLLPCLLIWGRQRGPRAARRFLFEFSWRFLEKNIFCNGLARAYFLQTELNE
ncbi:MAG TPA: glycosyltransferase [Mariprofundaceae bacterium]|nr:glycosyltransferase [Mariprofundaceae bacterium]